MNDQTLRHLIRRDHAIPTAGATISDPDAGRARATAHAGAPAGQRRAAAAPSRPGGLNPLLRAANPLLELAMPLRTRSRRIRTSRHCARN